ncbi:hypothetical protein TARUN_3540 [Trichoderma arundinaceum]|uniref:Uncharacterized protein n=1 Tax=Trichoderma arundinaceum TaxID=490622 RepID=A0A395NRY3_TRIAR|nr:hypothetical protein TARUN_3540 [Trichoderma arundinaceum]
MHHLLGLFLIHATAYCGALLKNHPPMFVFNHRLALDYAYAGHEYRLPSELVGLICHWIHADRATISKPVNPGRQGRWGFSFTGNCTQFSRTLARLSLASKRYRQIALPYLYSYIVVTEYDKVQLPVFVSLLCHHPELRPLVKEIDIQSLPRAFTVNVEAMGATFNDAAAQFGIAPLVSWSPTDCSEGCSEQCHQCVHFRRLLILLFLLTPSMDRLSMMPPNHFYLSELADVTWKAIGSKAASPCITPALTSLQHLWVPGAQPVSLNMKKLEPQEIGLQLSGWLTPSLRTLRLRNTCIFHPLPEGIRLDNLKEIILDVALLTSPGLFTLISAWAPPALEFIPEDIVPAFAHLTGTLRNLAINRWDGVRGGADHDVDFTRENSDLYATCPNWRGNGKVIGTLKDFTALETLKLDSTCIFHQPLNEQTPLDLPTDHLTERLPKSLRHLVLPGAPPQMVPALHALAASAASKEFPVLRLVEITSDASDVQKREISIRKYAAPSPLIDTFSRFINIEEWKSLEQEFTTAGVKLVHIDSGNTKCFAREILENNGLLDPAVNEEDPDGIHR